MQSKFLILLTMTAAPTLAGYVVRRMGLASQRLAEWLMTGVLVFGYSAVGFLSIWGMCLKPSDAWLPTLGAVHVCAMIGIGLLVGRALCPDRPSAGLFGIASGLGNAGFTMGGFVIFVLYGQTGLGLASIYCLMWTPVLVLLAYPVARHYAGEDRRPLGKLMLGSLLNWRAIPLPTAIVAMFLAGYCVPQPAAISRYRVVDVLVFAVTATAYFSIGLRLHVGEVGALARQIAALAGMRFVVAAGLGLLLVSLTRLTAAPLTGMARDVYLIESFVPTAVTMVGLANMFHLRPRNASALFVTNTLIYLLAVLPLVLWAFGD